MYSIKISNDNADLYIYSAILDASSLENAHTVIEKLNSYEGSKITLHINSEGGDVFEAQGMYSYLKHHKAEVDVYIDGLCASAAGVIALAGNKIYMPENALMMIHNPSGAIYGESEDMRKLADILDKIRDSIAILYEEKTGLTHKQVIELMNAETWLNAKEAKKLKLVDEILPAINVKNKSEAYQEGVQAERERIRALDEISTEATHVMIERAKYETFQTANDLALDLLRLQARNKDAQQVNAYYEREKSASTGDLQELGIKAVSDLINRMRGY